MQETTQYVTRQELWWIISAAIGITSIIVGIIMGLLNRSHRSYILEEVEKIRESQSKDLINTKNEMNEIKFNYLDRFDEIKKINQEILIALEKIKTEIEHIKRK